MKGFLTSKLSFVISEIIISLIYQHFAQIVMIKVNISMDSCYLYMN